MGIHRGKGIITFLIVLGIALLVNLLGFAIEISSKIGFLKDTPVPIRTSPIPVLILSILYLACGVLLWIWILKINKNGILAWHVFAGVAFLLNIYKILFPTYLVSLVPFYAVISSIAIIAIWYGVFYWLKKEIISDNSAIVSLHKKYYKSELIHIPQYQR